MNNKNGRQAGECCCTSRRFEGHVISVTPAPVRAPPVVGLCSSPFNKIPKYTSDSRLTPLLHPPTARWQKTEYAEHMLAEQLDADVTSQHASVTHAMHQPYEKEPRHFTSSLFWVLSDLNKFFLQNTDRFIKNPVSGRKRPVSHFLRRF